jgi:hypothetical protein
VTYDETAARAEAERRWPTTWPPSKESYPNTTLHAYARSGFEVGARWQAEQEPTLPTEDEVALALCRHAWEDRWRDSPEWDDAMWTRLPEHRRSPYRAEARAVLALFAAKEARS